MEKIININGSRFLLPAGMTTKELQNLAGVLLTMTPEDYCYLLDASRSVYFASDRGASVSFEAMVLVSQTEAEAQAKASREAHDAKKAAKVEA